MQSWLDKYTPAAVNAAHNLQPIWSQLSEKVVRYTDSFERSKVRFEDGLDRAKSRFSGILSDIDLPEPKELTQ
jgi:propane monooxygenase small subunit